MRFSLNTLTGKTLASLALVGTAAGVAGLGTYGAFTSSTAANASVASGTVGIALGTAATDNRLNVAAAGLVPGDTAQRAVTLTNATGNQNLSSITLTTAASGLPGTVSSKLDTDTTNGLKLSIDSCPTPWTEAGTSPAFTYTCSGTSTSVLASRPVIGANLALTGLTSLTAGSTDHLRVTLSLPTGADNTFQNQSSVVNLAFNAAQLTGTNK